MDHPQSFISKSWLSDKFAVQMLGIERGERMLCPLQMDEASSAIFWGSPWLLNLIHAWGLEVSKPIEGRWSIDSSLQPLNVVSKRVLGD